MILAAGIDDPAHGLLSHGANGFCQLFRTDFAGAGIDEDHASRRHDEAVIGVEAIVFRAALPERADDGIYPLGHRLGLGQVVGLRRRGTEQDGDKE